MAQSYTIYRINSIVTLIFGCPANLMLIWLILFRTSRALQIWSAIIDLALVFSGFIIQSVPASEGQNLYGLLLGPLAHIQNTTIQYVCYFFSLFLVEFAKYAMAVQFFYRWLVICRERKISIRQYCLCLCIPLLLAIFYAFLLFYAAFRQAGNAVMNSDKSELYLFFFNSSVDEIIDKIPPLWAVITNMSTVIIIIVCNLLIWRKTRQNLLPSDQKSLEISRQVGRVLLIQAIIPIVLQMLPRIFLSLYVIIGQGHLSWSSFLYAQMWTSCIYPVATMAIVGHYRRQFIKWILSWKNTSIYPSTAWS